MRKQFLLAVQTGEARRFNHNGSTNFLLVDGPGNVDNSIALSQKSIHGLPDDFSMRLCDPRLTSFRMEDDVFTAGMGCGSH